MKHQQAKNKYEYVQSSGCIYGKNYNVIMRDGVAHGSDKPPFPTIQGCEQIIKLLASLSAILYQLTDCWKLQTSYHLVKLFWRWSLSSLASNTKKYLHG